MNIVLRRILIVLALVLIVVGGLIGVYLADKNMATDDPMEFVPGYILAFIGAAFIAVAALAIVIIVGHLIIDAVKESWNDD